MISILLYLSMSFSYFTVNIIGAGQFKEFRAVEYDLGTTTLIFQDFDCYGAIPNAKGGGLLKLYTPGSNNQFFLQHATYHLATKTFTLIPMSASIWCEQITMFADGFE